MGVSASSMQCECQTKYEFKSLDSPELKILLPKSNSFDENGCDFSADDLDQTLQTYSPTQRRKSIATSSSDVKTVCTKCKNVPPNNFSPSSPPKQEEFSSPKSSKTPKKLTFSIPNPVKILTSISDNSPSSSSSATNKFFTPSKRTNQVIPEVPPAPSTRNGIRRGSTPGREESASDLEKFKDTRSRSRSSPQPHKSSQGPKALTYKSLDSKQYGLKLNRVRNDSTHSDEEMRESEDLPPLKISTPKKMNTTNNDCEIVVGQNFVFSNSTNNHAVNNSPPTTPDNQQDIDFSTNVPRYKQPLTKITSVNQKPIINFCPMDGNKKGDINSNCRAISPLEVFRNTNFTSRSDLILRKKNRPVIVPEEEDKDLAILSSSNNKVRKSKQFSLFKFKSDSPQGSDKLAQIKYHQSNPEIDSSLNENVKIAVDLSGAAPNVGGKKLPIYVIPPTSPSKMTQNARLKGVSLTEEKKRKMSEKKRCSSSAKKKTSKKMFSW